MKIARQILRQPLYDFFLHAFLEIEAAKRKSSPRNTNIVGTNELIGTCVSNS